MFSALKKLAAGNNKNEVNGKSPTGSGPQTMHASLQKKFAKGVHYNMKIIIRGDRNVGKSCLFHRLQGKGFIDEYVPTQEIQVASINWSYKATDDIVKVEVWDVVDKGKKKKPQEGLKLNTAVAAALPEEPALDAEFLDVYKGTQGVILMMDITKQWTFDYIKRELPKIPTTIPVIVLANHRDMGHHRCVSEDDVKYFVEGLNRGPNDAQIRFGEASMRNSFGLKLLHKFFNLPFLALQRDSLLKQLETNRQEMALTNDELDLYLETDDANYDKFLDLLTQRRRQTADAIGVANVATTSAPPPNPTTSIPSIPSKPLTTPIVAVGETTQSGAQPKPSNKLPIGDSPKAASSFLSVDEFVVDGDDSNQVIGFLSSVDDTPNVGSVNNFREQDSDSDGEEEGNPMVMGFRDEIDDEDFKPSIMAQTVTQISDSSEEDEPVLQPTVTAVLPKITRLSSVPSTDDDLDDWLNGGSTTRKQNKDAPAFQINEDSRPPARLQLSETKEKKEDDATEVVGKSHRRSKDKKSKRKSKKFSKEAEHSADETVDAGDVQQTFSHGEYEEI